jgi:predicted amidohydrolase
MAPKALRRRRKEASAAGCSVSLSGTLQKHSDILQLPGAALIARGGEIIWVYRGTHPGDLPPPHELLAVIDRSNPSERRPTRNQPTVDGSA